MHSPTPVYRVKHLRVSAGASEVPFLRLIANRRIIYLCFHCSPLKIRGFCVAEVSDTYLLQ